MSRTAQIAKEREIINEAIRAFFKGEGYVEVETPVLLRSPGMEPNLLPFETVLREPNGKRHAAALLTSPEYSMKKLLGLGMEKIFTLTKVFRNGEAFGGLHHPEFTMVEWYRQDADYFACMDETEAMIKHCYARFCHFESNHGGSKNLSDVWLRTRVCDLFQEYVGIDFDPSRPELLAFACERLGIHYQRDDTQGDLFYRLFLAKIEPHLHGNQFVYDYPKYEAALARLTPNGKYAERFELYLNGLEICNGFTELTNAAEQRERFKEEANERRAMGKTVHPMDETFLDLLPSLRTPTFGNALGIDRLHMAFTGRNKIEEVLLFPASRLFEDF